MQCSARDRSESPIFLSTVPAVDAGSAVPWMGTARIAGDGLALHIEARLHEAASGVNPHMASCTSAVKRLVNGS